MSARRPRVAVVGAGWAGLAAAVELAGQCELTLFEAGREPGGRARRVALDDAVLDNGQHILIGAYRECLRLMRKVGVDPEQAFLRQPLTWLQADGLQMRCPSWPAPFHLAWGLLSAKGLSWPDKLALARALQSLKQSRWQVAEQSVAAWLAGQKQPAELIVRFWRPLVLSGMNTPLETASMVTCARMLQDSLGGSRADSELLLPRYDLSELFPRPALDWLARQGAGCRLATRVRHIDWLPDGVVIDGERFDAVVLALAPYHLAPLIDDEILQAAIKSFSFQPIYTVYLRFAEPPRLPAVMTGLAGGTAHWLFDRGALTGDAGWLAAVISAAGELEGLTQAEIAARVLADVQRVDPAVDAPLESRVIAEKRATFAATAGLRRPSPRLRVQYGYLAGDWLHPCYPATLEGAVQSGVNAACAVLQDWIQSNR
jgi:squalene-associated FAD-dependent desaturase